MPTATSGARTTLLVPLAETWRSFVAWSLNRNWKVYVPGGSAYAPDPSARSGAHAAFAERNVAPGEANTKAFDGWTWSATTMCPGWAPTTPHKGPISDGPAVRWATGLLPPFVHS